MMENTSSEIIFVLHGLNNTRTNKDIYFAFGLVVYILTLCINLTLVIVVILDKALHEPMYLFICNLSVNGIWGASSFYPKILADLLSDQHVISYTGCLSQAYAIYVYIFFEYTCLTVMSYDRYVAICKPLMYHTIMTVKRGLRLLIVAWLCSFFETTVGFFFTSRLRLCGNEINQLYCFNWEIVKLSCSDVTLNNVYSHVLLVYHISQAVIIIVSYVLIIKASLRSKTGKVKFMQTCLPHLITLINFTISLLFNVMYARYGKIQGMLELRNIMGIEFFIVPPLLNPIIYGMKLTQIRHGLIKLYRQSAKILWKL